MGSIDLDLNIDNYEKVDLENFFHLDKDYDENEILEKEVAIREILLSSGHLNKYFKRDLIIFLNEAKTILMSNIKKESHTTLYIDKKDPINNYPEPKNVVVLSREGDIIQNKKTEFLYNQSSEFFPGVLNPLDTRILKKTITIDSRYKSNSNSNSDFIVSLPNKIQKVVSMECISLEINKDLLHNISSSLKNNYIYVSIITVESEFNQVFILPDGNYTDDLLLYTLNRMFHDQKNTPFALMEWKKDPYGSNKCVCMINEEEENVYYAQKIKSVEMNSEIGINGEIDITQEYFTKLQYLLGFTKKKYIGKLEYISEISINVFSSVPYYYLHVDDYQNRANSNFESMSNTISLTSSILTRVSVNTGEIVKISRKYFGPVDITRLHVRILDTSGRSLDLNSNFSFCLIFNVIYDL
jgi:hypothetical protein